MKRRELQKMAEAIKAEIYAKLDTLSAALHEHDCYVEYEVAEHFRKDRAEDHRVAQLNRVKGAVADMARKADRGVDKED